jgi:hypothetical protein
MAAKNEPGLYACDEDGKLNPLPPGSYNVDDEGAVSLSADWNQAISKIPWEKTPEILQGWGKRGTTERLVNLIGMYLLVAAILGIAAYLAAKQLIEGQALVAFLGAALGYLLSRGKAGLLGQQ